MQKFIAFLNKHSILLNTIAILFWLYIIIIDFQQIDEENTFDERKNSFIIPIVFILVSSFNMYMAYRRNKKR